jgi:hypothetical protein
MLAKYVTLFWTAIYKRALWNEHDIRFPKAKYEDSFVIPLTLVYAHKLSYINKGFYHYMVRNNSISTMIDDTKYQHKLQLFNQLIATVKDRNLYEKFKDEFDFIYIRKAYLTAIMNYVANSEKPKVATIVSIRNETKTIIPNYAQNKYYKKNILVRGTDLLFIYFPKISIKFYKFYARKKRILN